MIVVVNLGRSIWTVLPVVCTAGRGWYLPQPERTHGVRCIFCDELDPMEMTAANKWADSPLATPISETVPETVF